MRIESFSWLRELDHRKPQELPDELIELIYDKINKKILIVAIPSEGMCRYRIHMNQQLSYEKYKTKCYSFEDFVLKCDCGPTHMIFHFDDFENQNYMDITIMGRLSDSFNQLTVEMIEHPLYAISAFTLYELLMSPMYSANTVVALKELSGRIWCETTKEMLLTLSKKELGLKIIKITPSKGKLMVSTYKPCSNRASENYGYLWAVYDNDVQTKKLNVRSI